MGFNLAITLLLLLVVLTKIQARIMQDDSSVVKSIQDGDGMWVDCIDINKQSSLAHPLLKDHKIQMKPTSSPMSLARTKQTKKTSIGVECPEGTVPIPKSPLAATLTRDKNSGMKFVSAATEEHIVVLQTKEDGTKYYGAQALMNVINEKLLEKNLSTAGIIRLSQGTTMIEAGWMVSSEKYGDANTHLLVSHQDSKCNDHSCSNLFVRVSNKIYDGMVLYHAEKGNPEQQEMKVFIFQDAKTKHWWVTYEDMNLGYWPATVFPDLGEGVTSISFGGAVAGVATERQISPPMGFATFPVDPTTGEESNFSNCGYFADMKIVNTDNVIVGVSGAWNEYVDCPEVYGLKNYGVEKENGYVIMYGGPGGQCHILEHE